MGENKTIGVIGLGYVGLPLTAALANVGYDVIGIDINKKKIQKLKTYESDIYEPGLNETLKKFGNKIKFTSDFKYLMKNSETILITVGTPLIEKNKPDYSYLNSALTSIGKHLRKGQLVVLKSTVVPGTTREHAVPTLEKISGMKAGKDFYVAYCPERTIEGLALYELYTLPKIVGGINTKSTEYAASVFKKLGGKVIKVSAPEVAEICKLADNLYRAMNIALANEIGELCENIGVDSYEVVSAVNTAYERTHLYKPGLGADGPCLSKDPEIFRYSLQKHGVEAKVTSGCISKNIESTQRIGQLILNFIKNKKIQGPKVALLGLAFKGFPETDDTRGSPAIKIINFLQSKLYDVKFSYYDPIVKNFLGNTTNKTLEECVESSNVVVFLTNSSSLTNLDADIILRKTDRPLLIIDSWHNIANFEKFKKHKNVKVFRVGSGNL